MEEIKNEKNTDPVEENNVLTGNEADNEETADVSAESADVSEDSDATAENGGGEEEAEAQPEVVYAYKWNYEEQFVHDKKANEEEAVEGKAKPKRKGSAARNYALIMICVFAFAFSVLAASLSIDNIASIFKDPENVMSPVEITEKWLPSCVTIYVRHGDDTSGSGSGFIVNDFGYVVTNYHVIKDAIDVVAFDYNEKQYTASVVGYDQNIDIALLYLEGCTLSAVTLADSDAAKMGEAVVAIGAPTGSGGMLSVSNGIISGFNRRAEASDEGMIQTNTPLNPGNSGGPLFDSHGNVVGVVTSKLSYSTNADGEKMPLDGIAYAVPSNAIKEMVRAWIEVDLMSPMLGITAVSVESGNSYFYSGSEGIIYGYENADGVEYKVLASGLKQELSKEELNAPENIIIHAKATGLYVVGVTEGLGAYGKIEKGDIVTEIGGIKTENVSDARAVFDKYSAGDSISVELNRDGQTRHESMILKTKRDMLTAERG